MILTLLTKHKKYLSAVSTVFKAMSGDKPLFDGLYRKVLRANQLAKELGIMPPYSKKEVQGVKARDHSIFSGS